MNLLDKLFSRELFRRTGERAIKIDAERRARVKERQREIGSQAINATSDKTKQTSLLQRINIRFPWLKLVLVIVIGVVAIMDLLDLTISKSGDPYDKIKIAPMAKHIKATTRDLRGKKLVALTFDDGPSPITTPILLDKLKEKEVYVTFFVLGNMMRNNPDIAKRAREEGHELGSHTMRHQNLIRIPAQAAEADINESKAVFKDVIGKMPTLTRPPYGNFNGTVRSTAGTPLIMWSVDTLDWKNRNVDAIVAAALNSVRDGSVILMHDIYNTSVDAVPVMIDRLRESGYEFVTVSEMAKIRHLELVSGNIYYNFYP